MNDRLPPRDASTDVAPAFYALPKHLKGRRPRERWSVLHPPYTMLHLSLVTIGACLVGPVNLTRLAASLGAFFLAVGVGAHCLDELEGRPLQTSIPAWQLAGGAAAGLSGAVALGIVGMVLVSPYLGIFIALGVFIALSYNLELFSGLFHNTLVLILGWGAFPIVTAYYAQHGRVTLGAFAAGAFGALITLTQRILSTPARDLRRKVIAIEGTITRRDGSTEQVTRQLILRPLELALRTLCWMGFAAAIALILVRFVH